MFEECKSSAFKLTESGYMQCSCCGSLHPKEFIDLIKEEKAIIRDIEWKHDYPYAVKIDLLNPDIDKIKKVGIRYYTEYGISKEEPIMSHGARYIKCKFYSHHLSLTDFETFETIILYIYEATGIKFELKQGRLYYSVLCNV